MYYVGSDRIDNDGVHEFRGKNETGDRIFDFISAYFTYIFEIFTYI